MNIELREAGKPPVRLRLIGTTTFSSGVTLVSYRPIDNDEAAE